MTTSYIESFMETSDYDTIFSNALMLKRAATHEKGVDQWANAVSDLLFTVINEWEKNPIRFPEKVIESAAAVAKVIEDIVVGSDLDQLLEEVG